MAEDPQAELQELLREVRRIEFQSLRLVTSVMAGGYTSVFRGAGLEFDGVREFSEGDDPRAIDWNVTARVGRHHVKKFVDERELTVVFLVDLSASMHGGYAGWSARQTAARFCACLALAAVRNHDKVGLVAFSARVDRYVPPQKGLGHALRIVRDCLALPAGAATTDLAAPLERVTRVLRRRSIVFLVSDFLADGWQRAAGLCARRHDLIAVRLLAPELTPAASGLARVRDPETGAQRLVDWSDARCRDHYAAQVAAWDARTSAALRRADVDCLDVRIPRTPAYEAIARPILDFFRMREVRSARS